MVIRTLWKLWPVEGWSTRISMVIYWLAQVVATCCLLTATIVGVRTGRWDWDGIALYAFMYLLSSTWFDYISWRRRALEAEKPLPPTQVVQTYSTVGAANIARMVERERRRDTLRHSGRTW